MYPAEGTAGRGGEMQPKHFTGACPVLEFCAAENFRANSLFPLDFPVGNELRGRGYVESSKNEFILTF